MKITIKHFRDTASIGLLIISLIGLFTGVAAAGNITVTWDPPTTNADGSPLTDLAGYKVYYGTQSGVYGNSVDVGNVTTHTLTNLSTGTYYLAATAYDTSSNESIYSNEVIKTVSPTPVPDIAVTDAVSPAGDLQMQFGTLSAGNTLDKSVTLTNSGTADLTIGNIAQLNSLSSPFSILNDYCSGQTVAASSSCSFKVRFAPASAGSYSDSFDIPSNDPDESSVTFSVSGSGQSAPLPDITVTDSVIPVTDKQIPFGNVTSGNTLDKNIALTNDGSADLVVGSIALANPLASPFSISLDTCSGQSLSPSSSCLLTVRFAPASAGSYSDSFDIPSNDPDESSVTFSVSGSGQSAPLPDITVTDSAAPSTDRQIPFGNVTSGSVSDKIVTVSNIGNADLIIGMVAQNNPLVSPFSVINDTCSGSTIPASSSCTFNVRFAPAASGSFSDTFDVPSNDPDESAVSVSVNGTGTIPPVPDISVTDSSGSATDHQVQFGNVTENLISDKTVTVTNSGSSTLNIGTIAAANPLISTFLITSDNCSGQAVSPSSSCTFKIRFAPVTTGLFNDSFDIPSNDPDESTVVFSVGGTGVSSIINNPPSVPDLAYPANNQSGLGTSVEFRWHKSNDPDGDAVTYNIYVCEDNDFKTGCVTGTNLAYLQGSRVSYAGFSLYVFLLASFISGAVYFAGNRKKSLFLILVFVIAAVFLVSCGGGGAGGAGGILQGGSNPSLPGNGNQASYSMTGLSAGMVYYWKVVADDGNGNTTSSGTWTFQTQ